MKLERNVDKRRSQLKLVVEAWLGWKPLQQRNGRGLKQIVHGAEKRLGVVPEDGMNLTNRLFACATKITGMPCGVLVKKRKKKKARVKDVALLPQVPKQAPDKTKKFYESYQWRAIRYDALKKNNGCCELCGRSKHDGIILHVDHIKSLRLFWHLRLDPNNLQVLCNECNHGKGNRDFTDWRPRLVVDNERTGEDAIHNWNPNA